MVDILDLIERIGLQVLNDQESSNRDKKDWAKILISVYKLRLSKGELKDEDLATMLSKIPIKEAKKEINKWLKRTLSNRYSKATL